MLTREETISLLIASPIISVPPSPPLPRRSLNLLPGGGGNSLFRFRRLCEKPIDVAAGGSPSEFPGGEKGKKPTSHLTPSFPQQGKGEGEESECTRLTHMRERRRRRQRGFLAAFSSVCYTISRDGFGFPRAPQLERRMYFTVLGKNSETR